jgi:hypothetical protein
LHHFGFAGSKDVRLICWFTFSGADDKANHHEQRVCLTKMVRMLLLLQLFKNEKNIYVYRAMHGWINIIITV